MMGDLSIVGYKNLYLLIPTVLISSAITYRFYDELNLFVAGSRSLQKFMG